MKIYTKTGDKGETSLFGGKRVLKDDPRIEAYGTVDELNSMLGLIRSENTDPELDRVLLAVQHRLFNLGADLATPMSTQKQIRRISGGDISGLEMEIDRLDGMLTPLTAFVLPAGSTIAAGLHVARTICRRAERRVVHLSREEEVGGHVSVYLNRLSDLLFVMARYANHIAKNPETQWEP